jgi:RNA polymerase sigma-70 factor (ECF subfamily)
MDLSSEEMTVLLDQAASGSEEAAQQLTDKYGPLLRAAVRRWLHKRLRSQFDSLDFVQDVWASFFARDYAGNFAHPAQLVTFLQSMARNKVIDAFRRRQSKKANLNREQSLEEAADATGLQLPDVRQGTPSQAAIRQEEWQRLVEEQRPRYREILRCWQEGKEVAAISQELGVSERKVRRVLQAVKARRRSSA